MSELNREQLDRKQGFDRRGPGRLEGAKGFACDCKWSSAIHGDTCPEHGRVGVPIVSEEDRLREKVAGQAEELRDCHMLIQRSQQELKGVIFQANSYKFSDKPHQLFLALANLVERGGGDKTQMDWMYENIGALLRPWRPIETAPKEEKKEILLAEGEYVGQGFWHDGSECLGHRGGAGWFWAGDDLLTAYNAHPTHWRPMPAAPKQERGIVIDRCGPGFQEGATAPATGEKGQE